MRFLLSLWNWKTSKEGKDGKVGVSLIILHMPRQEKRELLFSATDYTCFVVSVRKGFIFLLVLRIGCNV